MRGILVLLTGAAFAAPVVSAPADAPDALARSPEELLARMDADADGRVSVLEYQAYLSRGFRAMDRNGDGVVDSAELPQGVQTRGTRRAIDLTTHERALARGFARQDADGDGFLDAAELRAPPR